MFLRPYERHKNGKAHTSWAVCESYRTARGSRQRVVANPGELKPSERSGWAQLGWHLVGQQPARWPAVVAVRSAAVGRTARRRAGAGAAERRTLERTRDFGDVVLPMTGRCGGSEKTVRLRCVTGPDAAQRILASPPSLPRRLRRVDDLTPM